MAVTLPLTKDERTALRESAAAEGISMREAAQKPVRDFVVRGDRESEERWWVLEAHAEVLRRLGRGR